MLQTPMSGNPHSSTGAISLSRVYPPPAILSLVDDALKSHVLNLLEVAGYNPTSVATAAGLNPHYVRQWLSGRVRSPGTKNLGAIAAVLGVTIDELTTPVLSEDGAPLLPEALASRLLKQQLPIRAGEPLPVRYTVQAGAWLEVDAMAQARVKSPPVTADPNYPASAQWLEAVRGDSVDMFYPEGSFVHVVDTIAIGYAPRDADFVAVERRRHQGGLVERSLKQIAKKGRRIELWPRSRNPKWREPLNLHDGSDFETVVEITALVIGGYLPARR